MPNTGGRLFEVGLTKKSWIFKHFHMMVKSRLDFSESGNNIDNLTIAHMPKSVNAVSMLCCDFQASISLFLSDNVSILMGIASAVRNHSPLKALISQLFSSVVLLAVLGICEARKTTHYRKLFCSRCGNRCCDRCLGRHGHHNSLLLRDLACPTMSMYSACARRRLLRRA